MDIIKLICLTNHLNCQTKNVDLIEIYILDS